MNSEIIIGQEVVSDVKRLAELVAEANHYNSRILLIADSKKVNVKSIMGVLGCGLKAGQKVTLEASGNDEAEALEKLADILK